MRPPEARFSAQVSKWFSSHGEYFATRIESSHTCPGFPDWLVLLPDGQVRFLELKVEGGKLTNAQQILHPKFERRNNKVKVLTKIQNHVMLDNIEYKTLDEALFAALS